VTKQRYRIEHLEKKHNKDNFDCGVTTLDNYLKTQANQDIKKNVAVTYVLTEENALQVLGYYTISSIGIFPGDLPDAIAKKMPRYSMLPGVLLGRLAVDRHMQGNKIGVYLLMDALKRSITVSEQIGTVAVVVEAKDEQAVAFYKHFDFINLADNHKRLFLPLHTIKKITFL